MSPRAAPGTGGASGARAALTGLVVVIVALGMFLLARARPSPEAFDPRSNRPDGTRALVLLLEQQGATVQITRTVPDAASGSGDGSSARAPRVLVLDDRLDDDQRTRLLDFVEGGGVLVVADPTSTLHGGPGLDGGAIAVDSDTPTYADVGPAVDATNNVRNTVCEIPALRALRGLRVQQGLLFPVAVGEPQCFGDGAPGTETSAPGGHAFVIRHDLGSGTVVGLGDNHLFTNQQLRFADNSGLATALLVPDREAAVTIVLGSGTSRSVEDVGTGDQSLRDLVRPGVWMAIAQLAAAFVVFAVARGVRVGRPVSEPRPIPLAGSEFVRASGSIMRTARHHERAGWMLRLELHRDLCRRYRLVHDSTAEQLAQAASVRDGIDPADTRRALTAEPTDDRSLLEHAQLVDRIRARLGADASAPEGATL